MVQTFERRKLNEEIEDALISAAQTASNVEMKLFSGRGNITGDFQDFYNKFNYLFRLTRHLKGMETANDKEALAILKKSIGLWMKQRTANIPANQVEVTANKGLELFDDYYHTLMHKGIVELPTRKG